MGAEIGLLERESELATIERFLSGAAAGSAGPLLIEGAAGAGKTALLDETARLGGRRGLRVLRARGGEYERGFPYGVVRQLFEPQLPAGGAAALEGRAAMAAPAFDGAGAVDSFSVFHGLFWLAADLAEEGPLLLAIDDSQWADLSSLQALAYVGRRLGEIEAGLAVTVRTGEEGDCTRLLAELRAEPGAVVVNPTPLSTDAVTLLAAEEGGRTPTVAFAEACRGATGGNPFLVTELFRVLGEERVSFDEGSEQRLAQLAAAGTSRAILGRLARLGETEGEVAAAVAILEPRAEARLVAELAGLPLEQVTDAGARLASAALFSKDPIFSFAHPLVREAVLEDLGETKRRAAHGKAARLLDADGAELDTVAAHLLLSEPLGDEWVVSLLRQAARAAVGRGAPVAAFGYLRRALREPPPPDDRVVLQHDLGLALLRGDNEEGIEVMREVHATVKTRKERAEVAAVLSNSLMFRGRHSEAEAVLHDALAENPDQTDELGINLHLHLLLATLGGFEGLSARYLPGVSNDVSTETVEGRAILGQAGLLCALGMGTMPNAAGLADQLGFDPVRAVADSRVGFPANPQSLALSLADRGDEVFDRFAYLLTGAERRGTLSGVTGVLGARAYCHLLDGHLSEAQADAETGVRMSVAAGFETPLFSWLGAVGQAMAARGEGVPAVEFVDRHIAASRGMAPGIPGAVALIGRGMALQASGRHAEACEDFRGAADRVAWIPMANPEGIPWRPGLVSSLLALGEIEEARKVATDSVELAESAEGVRGIGVALRLRGTVEGGESGIADLRRSVEILSGTRARLQLAHSLVELGAALRRANQRKESRRPLADGLEIAHCCGALPLEDRARTELAAAGARPRKVVRTGVESLTPSELRIARLAAEGRTNREIAQALTVTPKTVETHLRHVFQKLDLSRRTQLEAALAET